MSTISLTSGRFADSGAGTLHVGVVTGRRAVAFVAAAPDRRAVIDQLAGYVGSQIGTQLHLEEADEVRKLLRQQQLEAAVELYFRCVGRRWDQEWLTIRTVRIAESVATSSFLAPDPGSSRRLPGML